MNNVITKYSSVRDLKTAINGDMQYQGLKTDEVPEFLKAAFRATGAKYPKFFKMDLLSKIAMVASELLLKDSDFFEKYEGCNIAVILQNASSSIDVDNKYWETVNDKNNYFPNPSLFVYTLANIMIGEICIKNHITGENTLFVFDKFEPRNLYNTVHSIIDSGRAQACICGWVDYNEPEYEAFMMLVEKKNNANETVTAFTPESINKCYLNKEI